MSEQQIEIKAKILWLGSCAPVSWDEIKNLSIGLESFEALGDVKPCELRGIPRGGGSLSIPIARSYAGGNNKSRLVLEGQIYNRKICLYSEAFELAEYANSNKRDPLPVRFYLMLNTAMGVERFG